MKNELCAHTTETRHDAPLTAKTHATKLPPCHGPSCSNWGPLQAPGRKPGQRETTTRCGRGRTHGWSIESIRSLARHEHSARPTASSETNAVCVQPTAQPTSMGGEFLASTQERYRNESVAIISRMPVPMYPKRVARVTGAHGAAEPSNQCGTKTKHA